MMSLPVQITVTHTLSMARTDFWPTLTLLVRACRETPTLTMMSSGHWEKAQVKPHDTEILDTVSL